MAENRFKGLMSITPMEDRMAHIPQIKKFITYLLILLSIGFIIGSFTLALILKSIVIYIRHTGWLTSHENSIVLTTIIFISILTLFFAKWLTIWFIESTNTFSKGSFSLIVAILLSLCLFYWMPKTETLFPN